MKRFLAQVRLVGLDQAQVLSSAKEEMEAVQQLQDRGVIEHIFVRADFSGSYIIGLAESVEAFDKALSELPLYPHMKIEIVPLLGS